MALILYSKQITTEAVTTESPTTGTGNNRTDLRPYNMALILY
jgi:hypothetical protein